MRHYRWTVLALSLLFASPVLGLTPRLVKDINTLTTPRSSSPRNFVPTQSLVYFTAEDPETGREFWRTDGTLAGTFQVLDACPGSCDGAGAFVARDGDRFFFTARDGGGAASLWVTGGTPLTTFRLTETGTFLGGSGVWRVWVPEQGLLYFTATNGNQGTELWRSDGTAVGTFQVSDVRPGSEGSFPQELVNAGGRLFFVADDGRGPSLWTSDGTAAGTRLVRDPDPRSASHEGPAQLTPVGRALFFTAPVPKKGRQLWKSDGTAKGTVALTSLKPGNPEVGTFRDLLALGNRLLFVADDTANRQELWVSDGTAKGTRALTRFAAPEALLAQDFLQSIDGTLLGTRLVFEARETGLGGELWITDGTPKGTRLLRDVCPGPCDGASNLETFADGGRLYFQGNDGARGAEPWVTDGTAAGTRIVRDLCPGACGSSPAAFRSGRGKTFFFTPGAARTQDLWRTNGTPRGTVKLATLADRSAFGLDAIFWGSFVGSRFVFNARDDQGIELWASDGTVAGTGILADIADDTPAGSAPQNFMTVGSHLYFQADDGQADSGLWRSDGSGVGTVLVNRLSPGGGNSFSDIGDFVASGGKLFFFALVRNEIRYSLWRSDETSGGTIRLTPEGLGIPERSLQAVNGKVFFVAFDDLHAEEVWVSDGTPEGTRIVADLEPGESSGSFPAGLTVFQGLVYFAASVGEAGEELWRTDGTPEGTVLVKDLAPSPFSSSSPRKLTVHAGRLWFFADTEDGDLAAFWSTDGTAAGTRREADLVPRPDFFEPDRLISAGSRLFLSGGDTNLGIGLWVYDGTGAHRVSDATIAQDPFGEASPVLLGDTLYFSAFVIGGSRGLWKSDGTEAGTSWILGEDGAPIESPRSFQVFDGRVYFINGGTLMETDGTTVRKVLDNVGTELAVVGGRLLFSHSEPETGSELWVLE